MEILTYDDVDSIKFIHGPKLHFEPLGKLKILICSKLKYFIMAVGNIINVYDATDILNNVGDEYPSLECGFKKLKNHLIAGYSVSHFSTITNIILDYSSTILTVYGDWGIVLFNLLDINEPNEWNSIKHCGIEDVCWTERNDIVVVDSCGDCFLYRYDALKNFIKVQLRVEKNYHFKLVDSCEKNNQNVSLIIVSEEEKSIIILTEEIYDKISFEVDTFTVPNSFVFSISEILEPIKECAFLNHIESDSENYLSYFYICSLKFISGKEDNYLLMGLVGGKDYVDGYVIFFKMESTTNFKIISYSINDLSFNNISNEPCQLKAVSCVVVWVKEWEILFMGTSAFSQMVLFTCNKGYINRNDEFCSQKHWFRLGMSEGYDINCTDYETGIFDVGICTFCENVIKDPKMTSDSSKIINPPIILISQTDGAIISHFIASSKLNRKFCYKNNVRSIVENKNQINAVNNKTTLISDISSIYFDKSLYNNDCSKNNSFSNPELTNRESYDTNYSIDNLGICVHEIESADKSNSSILDVLSKIENDLRSLESKFNIVNASINAINNTVPETFSSMDNFIQKVHLEYFNNNRFDELLYKYGKLLDFERQVRRIYFGMMHKFPHKIYQSSNFERIKEKFRRNELTSSQISILFYINNSILNDLFRSDDSSELHKIMESLSITEKQCLKLASRISHVSRFCQRLNTRINNCLDYNSYLLPQPLIVHKPVSELGIDRYEHPPLNLRKKYEFQGINLSSNVRAIRNPFKSHEHETVKRFGYSHIKKIDSLSDIINNISNSISPIKEVSRSSLGSNDEFVKTPGKMVNFNIRSEEHNVNNVQKNHLSLRSKISDLSKINSGKIPYFDLNWTPTINGDFQSRSNSLFRANFNSSAKPYSTVNLSTTLDEVIHFAILNCHEQLERIVDQCDIIKGSISFIRRESLVKNNLLWSIGHINSKSMNSEFKEPNNDLLTVSHFLLLRDSNREKNMFYRQKMNFLLNNNIVTVDSFSNKKKAFHADTHKLLNGLKSLESSDKNQNNLCSESPKPKDTMSAEQNSTSLDSNKKDKLEKIDDAANSEISEAFYVDSNYSLTELKNELEAPLKNESDFETNLLAFKDCLNGNIKTGEHDFHNSSIMGNNIMKSEFNKIGEYYCEKPSSSTDKLFPSLLPCESNNHIEEPNNVIPSLKNYNSHNENRKMEYTAITNSSSIDFLEGSLKLETAVDNSIITSISNQTGLEQTTPPIQYGDSSISKPISEDKLYNSAQFKMIPTSHFTEITNSKGDSVGNLCDSRDSTGAFQKSTGLGGIFGGVNAYSNNSPAPTISGFGSSQFLTNGPFSSSNEQKQNDSKSSLFMSSFGSSQPFFENSDEKRLSPSLPFSSHPIKDKTFSFTPSSNFQGFSLLSNKPDGSYNLNGNINQFNFAPPPKPRQVNKLD